MYPQEKDYVTLSGDGQIRLDPGDWELTAEDSPVHWVNKRINLTAAVVAGGEPCRLCPRDFTKQLHIKDNRRWISYSILALGFARLTRLQFPKSAPDASDKASGSGQTDYTIETVPV